FFSCLLPLPPLSSPFPYTTLFRSCAITFGRVCLNPQHHGLPQRAFVIPAMHHCGIARRPDTRVEDQRSRRRRLTHRVAAPAAATDRKSTRLNSSHEWISYAVFCLK